MCGIFGFAARKNEASHPAGYQQAIKDLFILSESRGKEAAGLALRTADQILYLKQPCAATKMIRSSVYRALWNNVPQPLLMAIGHSRLVTNGTQLIHGNNQPVWKDGIVGIHNGIIVNGEELWPRMPSLSKQYDIDTEVILSLIESNLSKGQPLAEALQQAYQEIEGTASLALLFKAYDILMLATNNGSLYFANNPAGDFFVFASERYILENFFKKGFGSKYQDRFRIFHLEPQTACWVALEDLACHVFPLNKKKPPTGAVPSAAHPVSIKDAAHPDSRREPGRTFDLSEEPVHQVWHQRYQACREKVEQLHRCRKCVLPQTMPFIDFDEEGLCHYCRTYQAIDLFGEQALKELLQEYRRVDHQPDCIVSLSGGRDSCYALHYLKVEQKMNPVAFTYDWGMVTDLARRNQSRLCGKLGIEHIIVSADIERKRKNIRKNVQAWLKKPDLGTIPLFMAGDKQYFHYANQLKQQVGVPLLFMAENAYEKTHFKTGFCGVLENKEELSYSMTYLNQLRMIFYYLKQFILNPAYLNASLFDTAWGYVSYYSQRSHEYINLFKFIPWEEQHVATVLRREYNWELAPDTTSTWRIGDGTAAFYNYIYYTVAGFTENDTFRSNQVREGIIGRDEALALLREENRPRYASLREYFRLIDIDWKEALKRIHQIPKMY